MEFERFKILVSETLMYYQIIEEDLKLIYQSVSNEIVDKLTLGSLINKLEEIDNYKLISKEDYEYLYKVTNYRNKLVHHSYANFIFLDNFLNSQEYQLECHKIIKDQLRAEDLALKLEKIRVSL